MSERLLRLVARRIERIGHPLRCWVGVCERILDECERGTHGQWLANFLAEERAAQPRGTLLVGRQSMIWRAEWRICCGYLELCRVQMLPVDSRMAGSEVARVKAHFFDLAETEVRCLSPLWWAVMNLPSFNYLWQQSMRRNHYQRLMSLLGDYWVVDGGVERFPPQAGLCGLNWRSWRNLSGLAGEEGWNLIEVSTRGTQQWSTTELDSSAWEELAAQAMSCRVGSEKSSKTPGGIWLLHRSGGERLVPVSLERNGYGGLRQASGKGLGWMMRTLSASFRGEGASLPLSSWYVTNAKGFTSFLTAGTQD